MPTPSEILNQLAIAANDLIGLAIAWHVVVAILAIAMIRGWRVPAGFLALPLVAPAVSVFMVSTGYGNWFNAASFLVLAVALTFTASDLVPARVREPKWRSTLGIGLVVYGAVYPHFVDGAWYAPLYGAPIGILPCPTLAVLAGYTLVTSGHGSRAIPAVLALWSAFYAVAGIGVLGVVLDAGLVVAAFALVALAVQNGGTSTAATLSRVS